MALLNFKASQYELSSIEYPLLNKGDYIASIVSIDLLKTKKAEKNGSDDCYLNIKFRIESGESKGRFIWDNANIINSKKESQDIGRGKIKSLAHITNKLELLDSEMDTDCLIGCILGIKVNKKLNEYNQKMQNYIEYYKDPKLVKVDNFSTQQNYAIEITSTEEKSIDRQFLDDIPF